jgi:hypothetical protein
MNSRPRAFINESEFHISLRNGAAILSIDGSAKWTRSSI